MTGKTHGYVGFLAASLFVVKGVQFNDFSDQLLAIATVPLIFIPSAIIGGLMNDVDSKHSHLGQRFPFLSGCFTHRGFTHSPFFILLFMLFGWFMFCSSFAIRYYIVNIMLIFTFILVSIEGLKYLTNFSPKIGVSIGLLSFILTIIAVFYGYTVPNQYLYMLSYNIFFGVLIGMISHIVADSFNTTGVPLLLPFSKRRFKLMGISTSTNDEYIFVGAISILVAAHQLLV